VRISRFDTPSGVSENQSASLLREDNCARLKKVPRRGMEANVRFGSEADMCSAIAHLPFWAKTDIAEYFIELRG